MAVECERSQAVAAIGANGFSFTVQLGRLAGTGSGPEDLVTAYKTVDFLAGPILDEEPITVLP